ncbi:MAG TPA: copper transporter [Capillimicrobium sp.]|nr:copper transporter [Capillimicrobium sp.]
MFDFRYHALSLVAVFLALAIGLLLGVAVGDSGLVSSAKEDIEASLRADVRAAQAESADLRAQLDEQRAYEEQTFPDLVANRLVADRIGLLFLGGADDSQVDRVREAIEPAGAELRWVGVVNEPPDLAELADRAQDTRFGALDGDADLLGAFAQRLGLGLADGSPLLREVRPALMRSFSGDLGPVEAVVVARSPERADESEEQAGTTDTLESGLLRGLDRADVTVVGVEELDTEPSQVGWYRDHDLASVDSIDRLSGRAALVFALAGADGAYGVKSSAEALLPRVVAEAGGGGGGSGGRSRP